MVTGLDDPGSNHGSEMGPEAGAHPEEGHRHGSPRQTGSDSCMSTMHIILDAPESIGRPKGARSSEVAGGCEDGGLRRGRLQGADSGRTKVRVRTSSVRDFVESREPQRATKDSRGASGSGSHVRIWDEVTRCTWRRSRYEAHTVSDELSGNSGQAQSEVYGRTSACASNEWASVSSSSVSSRPH